MLKSEFSNQKLKVEQLEQSIEGQLDDLSGEELDNVVGGFFWNPYPNPWTPVIINQTQIAQRSFDIQHENFLEWLRS